MLKKNPGLFEKSAHCKKYMSENIVSLSTF